MKFIKKNLLRTTVLAILSVTLFYAFFDLNKNNALAITISGILKKLYMGEKLNFIFFNFGFEKDNFQLADSFYIVHIYANYLLITLVILHILAVIAKILTYNKK